MSSQPTMKIRLTTRGRVVLGMLASAIIIAVFATAAMLSAPSAGASADEGTQTFSYVVAQPGDSMWSIASTLAPTADPRDVIADIVRLNQLDSAEVQIGQEIAVPLKYADSE